MFYIHLTEYIVIEDIEKKLPTTQLTNNHNKRIRTSVSLISNFSDILFQTKFLGK